jgi:hypothetical protein
MALTPKERAELEQLRAKHRPTSGSASRTPSAPEAPAPSFGRSMGLNARDLAQAVTGLPGLALDVMGLPSRLVIKGYEAVTGKETDIGKAPLFNQALDQTMTRAGLPVPVTEGEKLASALKQGVVGTLSGQGFGALKSFKTAAPTVSNMLTSQPVLQTASAVPASTAAYYAGEAAGDSPYAPLAQIGAGMVGGMTPSAATAFGRKLASPLKISNPPETQRLIGVAEKEGISLTPGTKSGSRPLQVVESVLSTLPFSSGPQRQVYAKTREQFNRAALKKAGIDAPDASPQVLATAFKNIGEEFDDLVNQTPPLRVTPEFDAKIKTVFYDNIFKLSRRLDANTKGIFAGYVEDFDNLFKQAKAGGSGVIDPQSYKDIATDLRATIRETRDPALKRSLGVMQNALDDLLEQNSSTKLRDQWADTRNRYRNMLIVDTAVGGGTNATRVSGDIPFAGFKQAVDAADQSGFARGRGEYNDLARVGDLLAEKIPNSGTPERTFMQRLVTDPVGALTGPAALTAAGLTATASVPAAAIGLATPYTLQKFINSPAGSKYILNQKYAGPNPAAYTKDQAVRNMITALTQYQRPNYEDFTK